MLDVECEHCGRVLIGTRQIVAMASTRGGIEIAFVCGCGRPGGARIDRSRDRTSVAAQSVSAG